jgi:3-oxoacyl-[acyl-carrier protein] reductase
LASEGADVIVNYNGSKDKALAVVKEIKAMGRKALAIQADVSDEAQVEAMRSAVSKQMGPIDILVNNAGIHQHLKFWELSKTDWDHVLGVDLSGPFLVTKAFIEDMKTKKAGRVINISSVIGLIGTDHEIHYAASKGGLFAVTKSMALELAPYGITVNTIAPGWIDTDMTADFKGAQAEALLKKIPARSVGTPEDIAKAVVFLASKDADWMTGETIHVNGGWGMY